MTPLIGHDKDVAEWVAEKLRKPIVPPYTAIGWLNPQGELCAGAVFNDWNGSNIEMTVYGPGGMTRSAIRTAFRYVFGQLKANRLSVTVERANKRMLRLLTGERHKDAFGFEYEGVKRDYFGKGRRHDAILYKITPERAARWMA